MFHLFTGTRIYCDYAAATPCDPKVLRSISKYHNKNFANPSALYKEAREVRLHLEKARAIIARICSVAPSGVIGTSGGTEANNYALRAVMQAVKKEIAKPHIIVSAIEHPSVLQVARFLESEGCVCTILPVNKEGVVSPRALKNALTSDTVLVSVMYANNEIGTIQPISELARVIRTHRKDRNHAYPYFHTDAVQGANYLPLSFSQLGVDIMTISSSKIYGPKGAGVCVFRDSVKRVPLLVGGSQEFGMRPGTENVSGMIGLAQALLYAQSHYEKEVIRLASLRDELVTRVLHEISNSMVNGSRSERLCNNASFSFSEVSGEELVIRLDAKGVLASTQSACSSHDGTPSHVIQALRVSEKGPEDALRISLGRYTKRAHIPIIASAIRDTVFEIREAQKLLTNQTI